MLCLLALAACFWMLGCSPPGPRTLLEGKRLLDDGKYPEAIEALKKATVLLPKNALAPNYLGLAYHAADQSEEAIKAYRLALSLDHKLAAVRYNLGCLYLERDNTAAAIEELRSYTLLQPGAVDGWLKQGTALFRARRLEEAEKSYRTALDLHARHPEALNGLGLIQMQRRRFQDALNHFNAAAVQVPPYAPAVLNSAIVQQQMGNRTLALQRYRQYLNLRPRTSEAGAVEVVVRQLELELNPQPLAARPIQVTSAPLVRGTASSGSTASNQTRATTASLTSNSTQRGPAIPPSLTPVAPRSNPAPAIANASPTVPPLATLSASNAGGPRPVTKVSPTKGAEALVAKPPELQVAQVQPEPVIRPAQEIVRTLPPLPDNGAAETQANGKSGTNAARRGFFSRLNPFGGKGRTNTTADEQAGKSVRAPATPASTRYSYLSPAAPTAGDSVESEKAFKRGVKAQRGGNLSLAITEYQAAVKADPANYDAYYNLGLAALERGDARFSLWAYEIALALKPSGEDARYNFGLALKVGGYWEDAAEQFQKIIVENSSDARAHLSLANLYAQQLQQPNRAREHYQRVLEINPKHAEAAKIRYWLAANP